MNESQFFRLIHNLLSLCKEKGANFSVLNVKTTLSDQRQDGPKQIKAKAKVIGKIWMTSWDQK